MPYCFSRSNVKFQGHTALKIVKFGRNWAFLDSNSSLNSLMVMKCCTKLETAKERCPIVFQSHPSNFKVTRDKTSPLLTQIGRFRTIGRSQLSNPSDLPCLLEDLINATLNDCLPVVHCPICITRPLCVKSENPKPACQFEVARDGLCYSIMIYYAALSISESQRRINQGFLGEMQEPS